MRCHRMWEDISRLGTQESLVQLYSVDLTKESWTYLGRNGLIRLLSLSFSYLSCLGYKENYILSHANS